MSASLLEETIAPVLAQYDLGALLDVVPTGIGLLHRTFRLTTSSGVFVLQRLHPVILDASIDNLVAVTAYLNQCGMRVPFLRATQSGQWVARDAGGGRWRVYPWLNGDVCEVLPDVARAESAGRLMGELHRHLAACPVALQSGIPHFHDTPYIMEELRRCASSLPDDVRSITDFVLNELPARMVTTEAGPAQIIHGDLKVSNILFNAAGEATGLVDFDTLSYHSRAIDVGDALRSWCNRTAEDKLDAQYDRELFTAAVRGYNGGVEFGLTLSETFCRRAAAHLSMELAARFLVDVVRDNYFGWNAARYPNRRSHNMARALGQYHLAKSFLEDG